MKNELTKTAQSLKIISKLCMEQNKAVIFDRNGMVTIYPENKNFVDIEKLVQYMGAWRNWQTRLT